MVASLVAGILLALGHHLFYSSLNRKPVGAAEEVMYWVTRQQFNGIIGCLFAFSVNTFLLLAVTTAYTQISWSAIKGRSTRLDTIDTIFQAATSFWTLFSFKIWWKYPVLLLLALIIWLIPIASVNTPSTLNIAFSPTNPVPLAMLRVPNIDFLSLNFAILESAMTDFHYSGPKYTVDRVVAATLAQGSIIPISPPATNSSWALDFAGPSLNCTDLQGPPLDAVKKNMQAVVALENCSTAYGYIAWTPSYSKDPDEAIGLNTLPFILSQNNTSYKFQSGSLGPLIHSTGRAPTIATLYTATFANMAVVSDLSGKPCLQGNPLNELPNITLTQCELYNTSYHVSFSFINGEQTTNITLDPKPYNPVNTVFSVGTYNDGPLANYTPGGVLIPNSWHTTTFQTLSYQAVMDSFGQALVGTIYNNLNAPLAANETSVMSTVLGDTTELAWLNNFSPAFNGRYNTLQEAIALYPGYYWNGIDVVEDTTSTVLAN